MPKYLDLFAGCGGLSLGLTKSGFESIAALELHPDAFLTYKTNLIDKGFGGKEWPDWLPQTPHDINEVVRLYSDRLRELQGTVDLIAGGAPCQGFSTNGRRDPDDPRNKMVESYLNIVEMVQPRLVLLENVRGFESMPHASGDKYGTAAKKRLSELGFDCWSEIIYASDWGVPQRRPRFICIGVKSGTLKGISPMERLRTSRKDFLAHRNLWPGPTTAHAALSDFETERDLDPEWGEKGYFAVVRNESGPQSSYQKLLRLGSNRQPSDRRLPKHSQNTVEKFTAILETCDPGVSLRPSDRKRLGIGKRSTTLLSPQKPSSTVTTLPDDLIHYSEPRTLSVRELARLQSFPDWFSFHGPYTTGGARRRISCPKFTQVGNAVPPLLAEAIGETLFRLLGDQKLPKPF